MKLNLPLLSRRLHLYFGLVCLPWFIMYGVTSIAFNHPGWFGQSNIEWTVVKTWPAAFDVDLDQPFPRELGQQLLDAADMKPSGWGVYRWGQDPVVYVGIPSFWQHQRLAYAAGSNELKYETRAKTFQEALTSLHARGGFGHDSLLNDAWAVVVDIVCLAFVLWVVSGLYLWWRFSRLRLLGGLTLLAGFLSFAGFMWWL